MAAIRWTDSEWVVIPSAPEYGANAEGKIKHLFSRRHMSEGRSPLKGWRAWTGYMMVDVSINGKMEKRLVHRLVCEAFHGPAPSPDHQVAHWDGDKQNNRSENLRWTTRQENAADKVRHGRVPRGERHHNSRLREDEVRAILAARGTGLSQYVIAAEYGVTQKTISTIWLGRGWAWLESEGDNARN